ncbi:MAG: PAS domain-containing protein, partial [Myxococcales bacterium]|nr:PAS domain-containing protein [Myxococcales bacterium]
MQESFTRDLLTAIHRAQMRYIDDVEPRRLFRALLDSLLALTESEYGFIGEIHHELRDGAWTPYLKSHVVTNIAWDAASRAFYDQHVESGLEFRNLDTLFGRVITSGEPIVVNDPARDPRSTGVPPGHPPLRAFFGVPFSRRGVMIGMVGIANRPGGYDASLVDALEPLLATCATIIHAHRESLSLEGERAQRSEELERMVAERTRQLTEANRALELEVAQRRAVERTLRDSEAVARAQLVELQRLYGTTPVGLALVGSDLRYQRINEQLASINGAPVHAHIGRTIREVLGRHADPVEPVFARVVETGEPVEFAFTGVPPRGGAQEYDWLIKLYPIIDEGVVRSVGIVMQDVTAIKRAERRAAAAERRARAREEQLLLITDNIPVMIAALDSELRYRFVNKRYCEARGQTREQVIGTRFGDIAGESLVQLVRPLFDEGLAGRLASSEVAVPMPSGVMHFTVHVIPELRGGQVERLYMVAQDITELKRVQAQLVQAGKLAAMGELGASVAHELNQPLTAIRIFVETMRSMPSAPLVAFTREQDLIIEQIERMARIVDNIRGFARTSELEMQTIDARASLDRALMLLSEQFRLADIKVVREIGPLPPVRADRVRLQQVFLNILSNALHALQDDEREHAKRVLIAARKDGARVEYVIEDNGPGVAEEHAARIFDPFFTTKELGDGTGLGLSLAYGIVADHHGSLRHEPAPGGGARFVISIPAAESEERAVQRRGAASGARGRPSVERGRVLLVDDEEVLLVALSGYLRRFGWSVRTASTGPAALTAIDAERFDAIVVDLRMPGMSGVELLGQVRARLPGLPVIV